MSEPSRVASATDEPVMGLVTYRAATYHEVCAHEESPGEERIWGVNVRIGFTQTMSRRDR